MNQLKILCAVIQQGIIQQGILFNRKKKKEFLSFIYDNGIFITWPKSV